MKKLIIMAALTVAAFGFNEANAQKVIKDAAGAIYIDVQDMPAGTFSTTTLNVIRVTNHAGNSVFKKLQIAKADLSRGSWATACGINTSYNSSIAAGQQQGAVNTGCKSYTEAGVSGWRVPTQRELGLMWIMKEALVQMGASPSERLYWTSNENDAVNSWVVDLNNGLTYNGFTKIDTSLNTRCVREVN